MKANSRYQPGRPLKYLHFIALLEDLDLYSPAKIVRLGIDQGLFDGMEEGALKVARLNIRHCLARYAKSHFPLVGDGLVYLPGQYMTFGWLGRRWKHAMLHPQAS